MAHTPFVFFILLAFFALAAEGPGDSSSGATTCNAELSFLPAGFRPGEARNAQLPASRANMTPVKLIDLSRAQTVQPTLGKNGFQLVGIPQEDPLFQMLKANSEKPNFFLPGNQPKSEAMKRAVAKFLEANRTKLGLSFDSAVPLDIYYHDTSEGNPKTPKGIRVVHIDLQGAPDALVKENPDWKGAIKDWLGPHEGERLLKDPNGNIVEIINLWLPVQEGASTSTLAVADPKSVGPGETVPYTAVYPNGEQTPSFGLKHDSAQQWYYYSSLQLGDGLVFNARETPHSAVDNPVGKTPRKYIDLRILLVRDRIYRRAKDFLH